MGDFETIIFEKEENIAYITLNRPQALNVFNIKMRDELFAALNAVKIDGEIRVLVLKGNGEKAFCAGADLSEFLTAPPPVMAREVRFFRDLWGLFMTIPKPLIAALHGYILGSGIEMALFCDIRIASENAQFGMPEVGLGIIPAAGGTQTLPRTIGRSRALEMLLTNRWLKAEEAYAVGLVNAVVPKEELLAVVEKKAKLIASFDPTCVSYIKELIWKGSDLPLTEALHMEERMAHLLKAKKQREVKP